MKVAIVHDYLTRFGGAERVLLELHKIFPEAPIFVILYDNKLKNKYFPSADFRASFLQKWPLFLRERFYFLALFFPFAVESFDFRDYDIVISSSSAFIKNIITRARTIHICYCHTPMRFAWDWQYNFLKKKPFFIRFFIASFLHYLRIWDFYGSVRVDYFLANSEFIRKRIKKYYGREAEVIYPPVSLVDTMEITKTSISKKIDEVDYFLIVSRIADYKKVDIAVDAFNKLGLPLVIVGDGPEKNKLKRKAKNNIKFLGNISDQKLAEVYKNSLAFLMPQVEDFGIAAVEAMSYGKPALVYRAGGALEIVIEGETGEFFDYQTVEVLADGVRRMLASLKEGKYNAEKIKKQAQKFSKENFEKNIKNFLDKISNKLLKQ